jgi:hypothetical protein
MVDTAELNDALAGGYMLVDFSIQSWGGTKTDREASDEIIENRGATKDAGRFVKNLLASADVELKEVKNRAGAIGNFIYAKTLPWSSNKEGPRRGSRLLAATDSFQFLKDLNYVKQDYDQSVQKLVAVWDQRVSEAIANLKGLGNFNDYPNSADVAKLFSVSIELRPVPTVSDFSRINIPSPLASALGSRAAAQDQMKLSNALDDLKRKLLKELQRVATQLGKAGAGEKTKLFDSLVTNMQNMVAMLRTMNVTGNPALTELADKIEVQLLAQPVQVYRDSPERAALAADSAKQLALDASLASIWSP